MIYFGDVPSVYQLETIKQMVGPALAGKVNAENSAALVGRDVWRNESPDGPRINEYFVRRMEGGKPPMDGWFDTFSLLEYPAEWVATQVDKRRPVSTPNTATVVSGKNRLVHQRVAANSIRRPLSVQA